VGRDALGQLQELPKPRLFDAPELRNGHSAVRAAEPCRNRDDDQIDQVVAALESDIAGLPAWKNARPATDPGLLRRSPRLDKTEKSAD
jgi:hypothetical protein